LSLNVPFDVVVKEISIQQCLHHPTDINDPMMPVVLLSVRTVNPIQNVQGPVGTHAEDVISSQVLNFSVALQDNELGKNCNSLQVDGESPQKLRETELRNTRSDQMRQKGKRETRGCSELPMQEGVLTFVVSRLDRFLEFDSVNDRCCRHDVNKFHHRVVQRVKCGKQIQIPSHKDYQEKFMGPHRNTCEI
jgi:hypothetical protein